LAPGTLIVRTSPRFRSGRPCVKSAGLNANTAAPENADLPANATVATRPAARRQVVWWLWPHVLSLDAPIVAIVWQHWWARGVGLRITWVQDAVLALGVWMIYLADRLADTRPGTLAPPETARHAFSSRHRRVLQPLLALVIVSLVVLTPAELPGRQFAAGLGLLFVAGGYFWRIHSRRPQPWVGWFPKEAFVGMIFAVGTCFFVVWRGFPAVPLLLVGGPLFGVLCFFNCALITRWETSARDQSEPTSLLNAFPWLESRLGAGCYGLAAAAGLLGIWAGSAEFLPIALGALALAILDFQRAVLSANVLRVLADLALLAPLLCGSWLR
jgi:hypothetical protein